jgi:anti-sigma factor RsiW
MIEGVQAIFWPTRLKIAPNLFGRIGRVLHWAAIVIGIAAAGAISQGMPATFAAIFIAFAMTGRAIRYILSGE